MRGSLKASSGGTLRLHNGRMRSKLPVYVGLEDLARASGYSVHTLRRHVATGDLPASRPGRRYLVSETDARAWLARRPVTTPTPTPEAQP